MDLLYRAANHLVPRDVFDGAKNVLGRVVGIDVSGNKVYRNTGLGRMPDKRIYPCSLGGGRTTDAQPGAHCLESPRCMVIKFKIGWLFGIARPEIDVRFIPDF